MQKIERLFKKPEYFFRPKQLFKRVFDSSIKTNTNADLLWGHKNFEVNPNETIGRSIQTFGLYDLALSEAMYRLVKKDSMCLDIGANIGFFSSLMKHQGGTVHSFEPHPQIFKRLENNCSDIGVQLKNIGISNQEGVLDLYIPQKFASNQGISSLNPQENSTKVSVNVSTLDHLFTDTDIDIIKLDVEGHEAQVLKGAEKLFASKKIKHILFEEFGGEDSETITFLKGHGFKIFRLCKGFFNLKLISPAEGMNLPKWEPPNYLACLEEPDWSQYNRWQILKL